MTWSPVGKVIDPVCRQFFRCFINRRWIKHAVDGSSCSSSVAKESPSFHVAVHLVLTRCHLDVKITLYCFFVGRRCWPLQGFLELGGHHKKLSSPSNKIWSRSPPAIWYCQTVPNSTLYRRPTDGPVFDRKARAPLMCDFVSQSAKPIATISLRVRMNSELGAYLKITY